MHKLGADRGALCCAALLTSVLLLAGCAPGAPSSPDGTSTSTQIQPAGPSTPTSVKSADAAQSAAPSGTLRVPLNGEPPTLDPAISNDIASGPLIENVFSTLLVNNAKGQIVPNLAESWTVSSDGTVYTFKLNSKATFHNGDKLEAKDVKYSWERALQPATKAPTARDSLGDLVGAKDMLAGKATELSGVRVVDPQTLEVKIELPIRGDMLTNLTAVTTSVVDKTTVESGGASWFEKNPNGSGPFKLKVWQHNSKVVLEAFPNYFGGSPKVATIEIPIVTDQSTELAQYENGELDVARVPLPDLKRIRGDAKLSKELIEFDRAQIVYLALNQKSYEPFKKLEVRQAVAHVIDRGRFVDQILFGAGKPSTNSVPPGVVGYDPELKGMEYDPSKAKELLANAGFPNGQGLPPLQLYWNPNAPPYQTMAEATAASLKDNLGMQVQVQNSEFARFIADMNKKDVMPAFYTGWSAAFLEPNYFLDRLWLSTSITNRMGFEDKEFDRLMDEANRLPAGDARGVAFKKVNAYLAEQVPAVEIASTTYDFLKKPYVEGLETFALSWGMRPFVNVTVKR